MSADRPAISALDFGRQYFERGFIASAAWSITKKDGVRLSDDVIDHAWAHRDEGMDEGDILPTAVADSPAIHVGVVERVAAALADSDGLRWDELCAYEADEDADLCESSTCVAAHYEDHDPDVARSAYRRWARAAIAALTPKSEDRADLIVEYAGRLARAALHPGEPG